MAPFRGPVRAFCSIGSALLILSGCGQLGGDDLKWARAALERNPHLTIVASDETAKTITVQVKGTNELHVVRAEDLVGTVPALNTSPQQQPVAAVPAAAPPVATTPAPQPEPPVASTAQPGEPAQPADRPPPADEPAPATAQTATHPGPPVNPGMASGSGVVRNSKGEVIASVGGDGSTSTSEPRTPAVSGKVVASGPGYTVSVAQNTGDRPLRLASATSTPAVNNAPVERRSEPMVCQGSRLLHINGRNLEFSGDAVRALDGCEIHITNSHIMARGTGVLARAANVHIKNSVIEGQSGSVLASEGAKVYTQQSTFKGLSRRLDTATFHDLGGTSWN